MSIVARQQDITGINVVIRSYDGTKFVVHTGWIRIEVPTRDGTGGTKTSIFNMSHLLFDGTVDIGTTADEAYAVKKMVDGWPNCAEKLKCRMSLMDYLSRTRTSRANEYLATLAELYGAKTGLVLFNAVHDKKFRFPAFMMRETGTSKLVHLLLQWPMVACNWIGSMRSTNDALTAAHTYGGSKCRCQMLALLRELHLDNRRIEAAFEIAKYLNEYLDPEYDSGEKRKGGTHAGHIV